MTLIRHPSIARRSQATALLCLLLCAPAFSATSRPGVDGFWVSQNFGSVIEIGRCDDQLASLCATLRWLWAEGVSGQRLVDAKNPDDALRSRPMTGLSLFSDMRQRDGRWEGRIYNPEDGRRYRASVTLHSPDVLKLDGCWGPFCRKQYWRRLGSFTLPTEQSLRKAP